MIFSKAFGRARSGLACAAFALIAGAAFGQSSERPPIYTNKLVFHLPVRIEERHRAELREIRLYVKCGVADWVRQETGAADIKYFTYRVPQDGEYLFSVATVDQTGQVTPADINREPPGLRVLVDTAPPLVELKAATGTDGKPCIKCALQDANPDYQSLKVSYRTIDGREQTLLQDAASPGVFAVTNTEVWGRPIQVVAKDRCGNVTQREFQLQNPVAQSAPPQAPIISTPPGQIETIALKGDLPIVMTPGSPPPPATFVPPPATFLPPPAPQLPLNETPPALTHQQPEAPPQIMHDSPPGQIVPATATYATPSAPPKPARTEGNRRLISSTRAALEYRIDEVGPSGVSKVEVWLTGDEGRTWRRLHEDFDRRSPAEVNLPGEGVFGIRLAVTNGNGFGGAPPKAGDEPTSTIEVDMTNPFVQLRDIEPVAKEGSLTIRWTATDKNLAAEPVSLFYRTRRDAPWQMLAVNLANDGMYQWAFPRHLGAQFFIRIEVRDEAGNIARAETNEPIMLDFAEPRASVVGVTGINGSPAP